MHAEETMYWKPCCNIGYIRYISVYGHIPIIKVYFDSKQGLKAHLSNFHYTYIQ